VRPIRFDALGAFLLAITGCSLLNPDEHSRIVTGPDGIRTFTVVTEIGGTPVACAAFGLIDPVHGTLDGGVGEREPAWLVTDDGRRLSIVWPAGFAIRFEPAVTLYSEKGMRVAGKGEPVELGQTRWDAAAGTFDDPYVASGLVFNDCYPFVD
jgi:hypothetical protein